MSTPDACGDCPAMDSNTPPTIKKGIAKSSKLIEIIERTRLAVAGLFFATGWLYTG